MAYGDEPEDPVLSVYDRVWLVATLTLLAAQMLLFFISFQIPVISILCTASKSQLIMKLGIIHLLYPLLFCIGLFAAFKRSWRPAYVIAISAALIFLPVQAWLNAHNQMHCDVP